MSGVRANIRTRDGGALPHAVLTLTDAAGEQVLRAATDREGAVRSGEILPEGSYTVTASAIGYTSSATTAHATGTGRTTDLGTFELARNGGPQLPPPGIWTIDPARSRVAATAQHLGISSVHGRFTELGGRIEVAEEPEKSGVEAVITASSIDTGSELRDRHIRSADFLNVTEHPLITYRADGVEPAGRPDRWTVRGRLALHGVVRDVDLDLTCLGTGPDTESLLAPASGAGNGAGPLRAAFRATAELRRQDFAMNYNPVVAAGIAAIGTLLKIELDIQAVQGESLPPSE